MNREYYKGIYVVVPTPLKADETVDHRGLQDLIDYYVDSGCYGLVVLGSGGEFPYFSFAERLQIVKTAVKAVKGRVPLLAGAGFSGMTETAEFIKEGGNCDIDGFLVVLPTYYPVSFDDVHSFYSWICEISKKTVFYYHYPQMTGLFYKPDQIASLMSIKGMGGIKESTLSLPEMGKHLKLVKDSDTVVFSGNSLSLVRTLVMGGAGAICIIPSFAPQLVVACYNAFREGDGKRANQLQKSIRNLLPVINSLEMSPGLQKSAYRVISRMPFPMKSRNSSCHAVIKETLRQRGLPILSKVRSPLPQITEDEQEAIARLIPELKNY